MGNLVTTLLSYQKTRYIVTKGQHRTFAISGYLSLAFQYGRGLVALDEEKKLHYATI